MTIPGCHAHELWTCHLGVVPYRDALAIQEQLRTRRQADEIPDVLLLLEHPPVYTRGRRSRPEELALDADFYAARGIEVVDTDRGGRVTYHGPGQLVGYPIVRVTDVVAHVRTLEHAIVAALADEGIAARSRPHDGPDYTGVWVAQRKIASLGVHVARGVATHGFAVNVANDLAPFEWVIACGLPDVAMTSIARERHAGAQAHAGPQTHADPQAHAGAQANACAGADLGCFRRRAAHHLARALRRRQRIVSPSRLGIDAPLASFSPRAPARGTTPRVPGRRSRPARADDPKMPTLVTA